MRAQTAFLKAFATYLNTLTTLKGLLTVDGEVNIHFQEAKQKDRTPYMVYSLSPNRDNTYGFDGNNIDHITLQTSFFTKDVNHGGNLNELMTIAKEFQKQFNKKILTMDDGVTMCMANLKNTIILTPQKENTQVTLRWVFDCFYKG